MFHFLWYIKYKIERVDGIRDGGYVYGNIEEII